MILHGEIADMYTTSTEVVIAKLFAAATNYCGDDGVATIELRILQVSDDSSVEWSRREKDMLLLCLDRSVSRVYPPLDPLQYARLPPQFLFGDDGSKVLRLYVTPSMRYFSCVFEPHCVEGIPIVSGTSGAGGVASELDAAHARRRWRKAAWLTARVFNEGSWRVAGRVAHTSGGQPAAASTSTNGCCCCDVLEAAATCNNDKRFVHVDVFGMEITGLIIAASLRYAYVAVPNFFEGQTGPRWVLVTRIGIPSVLAETREIIAKRMGERDVLGGHWGSFCNEKEVMSHDDGPLLRLASHQYIYVTVRAHKAFCKSHLVDNDDRLTLPSVTFEDVAIISHGVVDDMENLVERLTSFSDTLQIVCESCARFLRGYKKYAGTMANSAEEQLFAALTDTVSVRMKRARSGGSNSYRPPVTIASPQEIAGLFEGTCVEFKANISKWHDAMDTAASGGRKKGIMNLERIRHTVAAMASTLGGVLVVGVTDDGGVIGHTRDVLKDLRLSGFCPAMAKGNITVTEMRVIAGDRSATMPKEWWKRKTSQKKLTEDNKRQVAEVTDRVVTVVTVNCGQAPFYATSRNSVPYMRGFASTLPMHVIICARRVANLLA